MIDHLAYSGTIQNTTGVTKTAPASSAQEAALARGREALSGMSDGETITGKVVNIMSGEDGSRTARVDIGGGALVDAKLTGNMALSEGQELSFSIRSGSDGQGTIALRPLYANTAADLNGMKALTQAGLPATMDNTAMVREMMSEGMPIDRGTLLGMSRHIMANPGHATSIVQMSNLGIPVTPENIEQFENYKNFEHQVTHSIDSIMEELPDAFRAMQSAGNSEGAMDLYGELLKLFSGQDEAQGTEQAAAAADGSAPAENAAQASGDAASTQVTTVITEEILEEGPVQQTAAEKEAPEAAAENGQAVREQTPKTPEEALRDALSRQSPAENTQTQPAAGNARADVLQAAMKALSQAGEQTQQTQGQPLPQNFTDLLRALEIPEEVIRNAQQAGTENAAQTELLRALSDAYGKTAHQDSRTDELWTKLFSGKQFTGILKEAIGKDWLLKPDDVSEKDNVRNLYERLQNQTRQLSNILSATKGSGTPLAAHVENLQNNLNFMNDLNHMFQFVQLPLKMNGQNTHGDLYVYANRKNPLHEDGTVSAVLHLDMEHMGPVDVFVKMRDNNVKTNFYLADDEMIDFLMEHIDILNKRLEKRGYNMDAKLMLHEEINNTPDAPVKEMLDGNVSRLSALSHTAFDALA